MQQRHIAEGNGRYGKADRKNFFRISRGSAFECVPILEICTRKGLVNIDKSMALKSDLEDICKMFSRLINY